MIIVPIDEAGACRKGILDGITIDQINEVLGFKPNIQDDPCKVVNSWGFTVDGVKCGIWDYKGSHHFDSFSTYGPDEIFCKLFPRNYRK